MKKKKPNQKRSPQGRVHEWVALDKAAWQYHLDQWDNPKRSTLRFAEFLQPLLTRSKKVVDVGCGGGGATAYLAGQYPQVQVLGVDYSKALVAAANDLKDRRGIANLAFEPGDWYKLKPRKDVSGVLSIHTIMGLPGFERPLLEIFRRIAPEWIGLSSLFYPGDISVRCEVEEHGRRKCFYNAYSIPAVDRFARQHGYQMSAVAPFDIDVDIPLPANRDVMGTYTVATAQPSDGVPQRIQISGPLLMNWHFVTLTRTAAKARVRK
ncbi:MAG: methyltransferase domain-containing protein [Pseudomonadota bacterium]